MPDLQSRADAPTAQKTRSPDPTGAPATRRLWTVLFLSRHFVIAGLAIAAAFLDEFGDDRLLITGLLLLGVIPYDISMHVYARRAQRLPRSMPFVYAPVPALFVLLFPTTWVPALLAAAGNANLFALTFPMGEALASLGLAGAALAAAAVIGDPDAAVLGIVGFAIVGPAIVVGTSALLQMLQTTETQYRDHVENANDMIYTHDLERLVFTEVNEAALRMTGYTRDELGQVTVMDIVAPEYLDEATSRIDRAMQSAEEPTPWELEIVTRSGARIPVEVNTRVIRRRGEPVAIQGIARDISERRQIEEQRAALDRARTEFIANAAHELRTPLTTLSGLASVLVNSRDGLEADEFDAALESLARQGRRAQLLADKLLDLSSIELGRLDLNLESVSVADAVGRVLEEAPPPAGVAVRAQIDPQLEVFVDQVRFEQIISNLLVNAYRYGGPHVLARADLDGEHVILEIIDDGPGVPADLAPMLFEPFSRGDGGRPDSTGLGLAICASIAGALSGRIGYRPAEHGGACFQVEVPLARPV